MSFVEKPEVNVHRNELVTGIMQVFLYGTCNPISRYYICPLYKLFPITHFKYIVFKWQADIGAFEMVAHYINVHLIIIIMTINDNDNDNKNGDMWSVIVLLCRLFGSDILLCEICYVHTRCNCEKHFAEMQSWHVYCSVHCSCRQSFGRMKKSTQRHQQQQLRSRYLLELILGHLGRICFGHLHVLMVHTSVIQVFEILCAVLRSDQSLY